MEAIYVLFIVVIILAYCVGEVKGSLGNIKEEQIQVDQDRGVDIVSQVNQFENRMKTRQLCEINIPTRGYPEEPRTIGVLTSSDSSMNIPLFGNRTWNGSRKWNYFTQTDKFVSVMLPVIKNGCDCSKEYGCDELYDGDEVQIPQISRDTFKVTLYHLDAPRYIPC
tara:strand:+ start:843 stop:1340 length:498 start_codon:yes stop_codon:yes gene_type:complete